VMVPKNRTRWSKNLIVPNFLPGRSAV